MTCLKATPPFIFPIPVSDHRSSSCSPLGCLCLTHLIHQHMLSAVPSTHIPNAATPHQPSLPSCSWLAPPSGWISCSPNCSPHSPHGHLKRFLPLPLPLSPVPYLPAILTSLWIIKYAKCSGLTVPLPGTFLFTCMALSPTAQLSAQKSHQRGPP